MGAPAACSEEGIFAAKYFRSDILSQRYTFAAKMLPNLSKFAKCCLMLPNVEVFVLDCIETDFQALHELRTFKLLHLLNPI